MEEEKAAAYYDELTRKGGGAARFKQGLGFSSASSNDTARSKGAALPSASSFLSSFVRASSPSKTTELEKQDQLESIQNKLKKKQKENQQTDDFSSIPRVPKDSDSDRLSRLRNRSRSPSRDKHRTSRYRSRSRSRDRKFNRRSRDKSSRRRSRSRSRSRDRNSRRRRSRSGDDYRARKLSRSRDRRRRLRSRSRSRSGSDFSRRMKRSESPRHREAEKSAKDKKNERNGGVDYAKMIAGYDKMTPAERVKAKMKLQLSETVEKDPNKGMGSKWEWFDFDKDAPLDDEEIEAVKDDATVVKNIGQSFRFSAVEARREEQIKNAHDQAMFGAPSLPPASETDEEEDGKKEIIDGAAVANLISDQVISMQQSSWRDRVRKT